MTADAGRRSRFAVLRRLVVTVIVVSFGVAALMGIIVLLGLSIGDTTWNVIATTSIVGAFSVAVLCSAALLERPARAFGIAGIAVSVLTAVLVIWWLWDDVLQRSGWDIVGRVIWTGVATSAAFSLASLLLLLSDRRRSAVRVGLAATLGLIALLLALTLYLVWADDVDGSVFPRVYGIVAILAALGAIVVPVLSLLLPDAHRSGRLDPALADLLVAEADRRGIPVAELVDPVLRRPETTPDAARPAERTQADDPQ